MHNNSQTNEFVQKQNYLRIHILEQHYNPEQFISFLNSNLNINSDLNKCSLQDLQKIVKMYIENKKSYIQDDNNQNTNNPIIYSNSTQLLQQQIKCTNGEISTIQYSFKQSLECCKIKLKFPQIKNIQCKVLKQVIFNTLYYYYSPKRIYDNTNLLITSSFLSFEINTSVLGWTVFRRYSHFIWLRQTLRKYYPTQIIPPIPEKKAKKKSKKHILKRMNILTLFLNDLINIPSLFNSIFVVNFLKIADVKQFEQFQNKINKKNCFENVHTTQTQTGNITIQLTQQNNKYSQELPSFLNKIEILYKEITKKSKKLEIGLIEQINTLYEMSNLFGELHECCNNSLKKITSFGIGRLKKIYAKLNNMTVQWGNIIRNQCEILSTNFSTFFKYNRQQLIGFKQLLIKQQNLKNQFIQMKINLSNKKQKIFLQHNIKKWQLNSNENNNHISKANIHNRNQAYKLMLPIQTEQLEKIKFKWVYYLSRIQENSEKAFSRIFQNFCSNFEYFSVCSKVATQQIGIMWNQMCITFGINNNSKQNIRICSIVPQYEQSENIQTQLYCLHQNSQL